LKKIFVLILLAVILFGVADNANALIFGIRFSNLNQPVIPTIDNIQDNKSRFAVFGGFREKNHDFVVSLDYDRHKNEWADTSLYVRRYTVSFGYRYRLFSAEKIEGMNINPFVGFSYFKSFSKVQVENYQISPEELQYQKDMANDGGGWLSLGAEYYFAPAFSMGCEGGIRYTRAISKAYGYEIKITDYTTFAAILLTFYWK